MPLPADSIENALEILRAAGSDASGFTFEYVAYPRLGCGSGPPPADVVVTNTVTGIRQSYAVRPGSNWLAAFGAHVAQRRYWP